MTTFRNDRLYAIVDAELSDEPVALAERTLKAGCGVLQLRAKRLADAEFLVLAEAIADACRRFGIPFIVNDRPDIAALSGADGVHLGQDDMPVTDARAIIGNKEIGLSTHDLVQAREAERAGVDRIAFGPVFPTTTKQNPDPVVGLRALSDVCRAVSRPVVAIGGISPENVDEVLAAGVAHVAVISALPRFLEAAPPR